MKSLRLAYVGNFEPRHSTETHIARTLEEDLGHQVLRLQESTVHTNDILADTKNFEADLFLYTRTWGFTGGDGHQLLADLAAANIPTASYHLDLYWGISREKGIVNDPFWRTKYVFTPDGASDDRFREIGINHFYIKPGVFRAECVSGTSRDTFRSKVGFVGSLDTYHPEWLPYRKQLKHWLIDNYGGDFRHWPADRPAIRNEDLNDLYASVDVVVGDSLCVGFNRQYYWSDRLYETLGRGGFLIHPYIRGIEEEFSDGENIVLFTFNDWDGLKEKIDFYLEHEPARRAIQERGQAYVRENCTYTNRLKQALEIIGEREGW